MHQGIKESNLRQGRKASLPRKNYPIWGMTRVNTLGMLQTTRSEVGLKDNVLEAELRRVRRAIHLGRVFFVTDCGFGLKGVAFLEDISTTGCRIISETSLQIGMELGLSLVASSDERDVEIEMAKVRWVVRGRFGLEFLAIDPLERERLRLFLKTV